MDSGGLQCHGCGSTNVEFDAKNRKLVCYTCGKEQTYSRATLYSNGKVVSSRQNAMKFFTDGRFEDARHYALQVLNILADNAPALYIMAYYEEFTAKNEGTMKRFFNQIQEVALEYDEVEDLRNLFLASSYRMQDFEEDMIQLIAANMQDAQDKDDLCAFIDKICPYLISKRTSSGYLTKELAEMYKDLAEYCSIPKTCFALLKSIDANPDSPYSDNSFYLKSKTRYFYDNYVLPIGNIIGAMNSREYKEKFMNSYKKKQAGFLAAAEMEV